MMKDSYKVLIRSCWVLLLICFGIKIFGGNLFEIACENKTFISICNYIDNNMFIRITINCIIALILDSLTLLAIMQIKRYNKIQTLIFVPTIIASSICGWYIPSIKFILDLILLIIYPLLYKTNYKRIIIGIILVLLFQVISFTAKNIGGWYLNDESTLIMLIINIDTVIMSILYYLYSNRERR